MLLIHNKNVDSPVLSVWKTYTSSNPVANYFQAITVLPSKLYVQDIFNYFLIG